ncbi:unnamed protein product [Paramecium octaurelia]|uniref:Uncharacterized protein n=1 Tax=Paramecium octaurelia TaxID=43137 RepID=A0A8S1VBH5_PAROT|nr:unnamed protein product [Paramecium octaurelia]
MDLLMPILNGLVSNINHQRYCIKNELDELKIIAILDMKMKMSKKVVEPLDLMPSLLNL